MKRRKTYWSRRDEKLRLIGEGMYYVFAIASICYFLNIPLIHLQDTPFMLAARMIGVVIINAIVGVIFALYGDNDLITKSVETFLSTIWFLTGLFLVVPVALLLKGVLGTKELVKNRVRYFIKNESRRWARKEKGEATTTEA